jgi:mannose-6-phosphate isomerase class I
MKMIGLLQNTIQYYEWGSSTAIPDFLEQKNPSGKTKTDCPGSHAKFR